MFKLALWKAEEPEIKLLTSSGSLKMQDSSRNPFCFCFIDYAKAFDCVDHNKLRKILKEMEYQTTWHASLETYMQVRKQQLELDMEQQTGSKLGMEYLKAVYCHPACLTYMQSSQWETLGWMKHKLESRLPGEMLIPQICRWHHCYGRKWRRTKEPLDESERRERKSWLRAQHSEN